jgi:transcriptional regulator with XRE-family HTH domain
MQNLHLKIKALRKEKGDTQEQVATGLGMTKGNLSRMEKGEVAISSERLTELAAYFGMSREELIAYETLAEKVTKEERRDLLSADLQQHKAQISRMQRATEHYLYALYGRLLHQAQQKDKDGKEAMKKAAEKLWATPAIEHLLNGENTSEEFPMLAPFRAYRKQRAIGLMEAIKQELGLSPDDPDPELPFEL